MSDESSVQEGASRALRDDPSQSRELIRVDKAEFTKLLHQVLAARNLYVYLQDVTGENKKLKQRNGELTRILQRSQKTMSQMIIGDSKVSSQARGFESGSMSLPCHFNYDSDVSVNQSAGTYSSLREYSSSTTQTSEYFSRSPKSVGSSLYVSEPGLSRYGGTDGNHEMRERGLRVKPSEEEEKEKSDPCKDEDTGLSLKVDGDVRSIGVIPKIIQHRVSKLPSPTPSSLLSPTPSLTSGFEDRDSVSSDNQSDDSSPIMMGVSRQYFDIVVKELAKSKQLIKQLLAKNRESPKEVLDAIHWKQLVKSLEEENKRLKESNHYFRNLLVSEATSEDQNLSANNEILNFHDKVMKLERQVLLKDQALDQLNKQNELWKRYGQKAMASQYTSKREDQVFQPQMQDSENQTDSKTLCDTFSQTDEMEINSQTETDKEVMLARSQSRVVDLERMIGELTLENQRVHETVDLLTAQNMNLEASYQQVMFNLKEVERNQDTAAVEQDLKDLNQENDELKKRLKENVEEMKFLRYQIQSAQSDQGILSQKKTRVEAMLKTERERNHQKETQLFTQCSKLQQLINKLESENEELRLRMSTPMNVARVQPVIQDSSKEPTSMPVTSQDFMWQQEGKDVSLMADSEPKMFGLHQSDPCLLKKGQRPSEEEFQCHHCLRNDFHDENSFLLHMQKCGD